MSGTFTGSVPLRPTPPGAQGLAPYRVFLAALQKAFPATFVQSSSEFAN